MGAYLGTVAYRIRCDELLVTRHCHCPSCGHILPTSHQIPVISWLLLNGKCHYCHTAISKSYPIVEGGFMLYYGLSFFLLWEHPLILTLLWMLLISIVLLLRCKGNYRPAAKGILLFAGYHVAYGAVLMLIHIAL
ncbi:MAG: prepilin peptidase [Candidatus Gastranaerophilales bacterium]|nr:prepilin peptidase [Candidatus Gastranaerophilales bacterium]